MNYLHSIVDFVLHLDKYLGSVILHYHEWTYILLFTIIFCETGLVVTPFLPGDSLLFVAGSLATSDGLNPTLLYFLLLIGAILGNTVNYFIGRYLSEKILSQGKIRFIKSEYLDRTQSYYQRYGGWTLIIARFLPIVRTFAPFMAGVGKMNYMKFMVYNVVGAFLWISFFYLGGYLFGNLPIVRENFSLVVLIILVVSIVPLVAHFVRGYFKKVAVK